MSALIIIAKIIVSFFLVGVLIAGIIKLSPIRLNPNMSPTVEYFFGAFALVASLLGMYFTWFY